MTSLRQRYRRAEQQLAWHMIDPSEPVASTTGVLASDVIVVKQHNLYRRDPTTGQEVAITIDGEVHYAYGAYPDFISVGIAGQAPLPPAIVYSPNQQFAAVQRIDERAVWTMPRILQQQDSRPMDTRYQLALPGDTHIPLASLVVVNLNNNAVLACDRKPVPASNGGLIETRRVFWDSDNRLYMIEQSRDRRIMTLLQIDPTSGNSRVIIEERGDTYIHPGALPFGAPLIEILSERNELIWYSQRSGWGQLYRYDLNSGALLNAVTQGEFVVTKLHAVDPACGVVYFSACGKELGRNPYYEHLYAVNLDGAELRLLTPDNAQHDISEFCLAQKTFVDYISRVDLPTQAVVRDLQQGQPIRRQVDASTSESLATGFNHPVMFTAKAADQITDLYGVIYRPSDFDPEKSYPVVLCIYGAPQECIVPTRYAEVSNKVRDTYRTLAELGLIAVMVDPRGTPLRGKAFHDVAYGNLQNAGGIDDQVAVLQQLSERHSWMDMSRVGITGHSGGGYASARAMMTHPALFKVCVASAGNHDQRLYVAGWAETFQGLVKGDNYSVLSNRDLIGQLQGKLLLVHGDADANVSIVHTLQLVDQLITANKDVDLLILPQRGHGHARDGYFIRRLWDYFAEHLLNETPPQGVEINPPKPKHTPH